MLLSICIPTYNRVQNLEDCLNSIKISNISQNNLDFEVCISDNGSLEDPNKIVEKFKKFFKIKFNRNNKNLGFALNAIKTVSMAEGEYIWMIGNDDLLLPRTLEKLKTLLINNLDTDFFFINSYNLETNLIDHLSKPIDTNYIPYEKMETISKLKDSKHLKFWEIIDPSVSWEFLIGIYLSIFKRKKWNENLNFLNKNNLNDSRYWSNIDNTLIHPMIMCKSFKDSKCFFCAEPLSVNLVGVREWTDLYEFIEIIRLPELLDFYRSEGMGLTRYLYCKNFSLRNFANYLFKIIINGNKAGLNYINFKKNIFYNLIYPNVYLSFFYYFMRKIFKR
jgi:glycosyltransferase involved in cell wall biosynthesis